MKPRRITAFFRSFAADDLLAREVRFITAANVGTWMGLILTACLSYGLVHGAKEVRLDQLKRDGESLCVRGGSAALDPYIDAEYLVALNAQIVDALKRSSKGGAESIAEPRLTLSRYRKLSFGWKRKDGTPAMNLDGRTVRPNDLLLRNRPCRPCPSDGSVPKPVALTEQSIGVIATTELLELLQFKQECPKQLEIGIPGGGYVALDVLGVTDKPLPAPFLFALSEGCNQWIKAASARCGENTGSFTTGVLPDQWLQTRDENRLPDAVKNELGYLNLKLTPVEVNEKKERGWKLSATKVTGEDRTFNWFRERFGEITELMIENRMQPLEQGYIARLTTDFVRSVPVPVSDPPAQFVNVYADDLSQLDVIADVMKGEPFALRPNSEGAIQRKEIGRQAVLIQKVFGGTVALVTLFSALAISAMEWLRCQSRRAEIGMLRALGMHKSTLTKLVMFEAILQTGVAVLVAGILIVIFQFTLPAALYDDPLDRKLGFMLSSAEFGWFAAAALVMALIISRLANSSAYRDDPAELIRT